MTTNEHLYAIIRPTTKTVEFKKFPNYKAAIGFAGLNPGEVDFGTLARGSYYDLTIIVYEFGLMKPHEPDSYFAINKNLFNGTAVVYASDPEGEIMDIPLVLTKIENGQSHLAAHITWLGTVDEVEKVIQSGRIIRPQSSINGEILWEWNK